MTIPVGYKCNQWGWFWKESDNSGPYYLDADGMMTQGFPNKFYTDNDGPDARLRVDQGSTSFYSGKEFRTFQKFIIAAGDVVTVRVTTPIDLILLNVSLAVEGATIEMLLKVGGSATGPWTAMPTIRKNLMATAPVYASKITLEYDGVFTGETTIDILRAPAGNKSGTQSAIGSERGIAAGVYHYVLTNVGNQSATVIFSGEWEERF